MNKKKLIFLEQKLKLFFKKKKLQGKTLLLAVSGGFDSMLMMEIFHRVKNALSLRIYVAYVHHGRSSFEDSVQKAYRERALRRVYREALKRELSFFSNLRPLNSGKTATKQDFSKGHFLNYDRGDFQKDKKNSSLGGLSPKDFSKSEQAHREFRYFILRRIKKKAKAHFIVLAHFKKDLLETRIIRLIRGTGVSGLRAMREVEKDLLRPFLFLDREDFVEEAKSEGILYEVDPSNKDLSFLRNWVRHKFLLPLEKIRPGSGTSLFRSLENISKNQTRWDPLEFIRGKNILYSSFLELDYEKKVSVLSFYMRKMGLKNYTLNHVNEVLKRLKSPRKKIHFKLLKADWKMDSKYITINP